MPITIGFDGTAAVRQKAGIGRYARELLVALAERDDTDNFKIIAAVQGTAQPKPHLNERFEWFDLPVSDRVSNAVWHKLNLPIPVEARVGRMDVFHSPDFSLAPSRCRSVVTIHDLAFEVMSQVSYPTLANYLHRVVPNSIRRSARVIAPSQFTKTCIVDRFGTPSEKITVIPEGVASRFTATAHEEDDRKRVERLGVTGPFILTTGTLEPRKNLQRLLQAFANVPKERDNLTLAIAGQEGWMFDGIYETCRQLQLGDRVRFLGHVNDDDLAALYRTAELMVYPSLLEGFGLPPLEALACGCAVVASGNSSIPEACGEAAVYIDPWDVRDITDTLRQVLDDESLRARLRSEGPAQAAKFTWRRAAEQTVRVYHDVATG